MKLLSNLFKNKQKKMKQPKQLVQQITVWVVIGFLVLILSTNVYQTLHLSSLMSENFNSESSLVEDLVYNRLKNTSDLYKSLEQDYIFRAMGLIDDVLNRHYFDKTFDVDKDVLSSLVPTDFRNIIKLNILNDEGIIINSSLVSDLGKNFFDGTGYENIINAILDISNVTLSDIVESESGSITRTVFSSSYNKDIIVAVIIDYTNLAWKDWALSLDGNFNELENEYIFIESVELYNANGDSLESLNDETRRYVSDDHKDYFMQSIKDMKRIEFEPEVSHKIIYIPVEMNFGSTGITVAELILSKEEYNIKSRRSFLTTMVIAYLVGLIVVWWVILRIKKLMEPVETLKKTIIKVSEGDYEAKADINVNNDFDDLGRRFDNMIESTRHDLREMDKRELVLRNKNKLLESQKNRIMHNLDQALRKLHDTKD